MSINRQNSSCRNLRPFGYYLFDQSNLIKLKLITDQGKLLFRSNLKINSRVSEFMLTIRTSNLQQVISHKMNIIFMGIAAIHY